MRHEAEPKLSEKESQEHGCSEYNSYTDIEINYKIIKNM